MYKSERGITLLSLVITLTIMMLLVVAVSTNLSSTTEVRKFYAVQEDINSLTEIVKEYYMVYGTLPIDETNTVSSDFKDTIENIYTEDGITYTDRNPNDNDTYYYISIAKLQGLDSSFQLNKNKTDDKYIINEQSFTVYYENGIELDGVTHYTTVDSFQSGGIAADYYATVDFSLISAVTIYSDDPLGRNIAQVGDTITLKILTNGQTISNKIIEINGQTISGSNLIETGNVIQAKYQINSIPVGKAGYMVPFSLTLTGTVNGKNVEEKITNIADAGSPGSDGFVVGSKKVGGVNVDNNITNNFFGQQVKYYSDSNRIEAEASVVNEEKNYPPVITYFENKGEEQYRISIDVMAIDDNDDELTYTLYYKAIDDTDYIKSSTVTIQSGQMISLEPLQNLADYKTYLYKVEVNDELEMDEAGFSIMTPCRKGTKCTDQVISICPVCNGVNYWDCTNCDNGYIIEPCIHGSPYAHYYCDEHDVECQSLTNDIGIHFKNN